MGKSTGMGFDDFGRLSDMNDDGVTMTMADPLSSVGPSATPDQRADLHMDAVARKQGGSYDPNTRTATMPDKSGQRKPQAGEVAGGSNVFIPSDPSMRINAGGGGGAAAPTPLEGPVAVHKMTGNVEDRMTGARMSEKAFQDKMAPGGENNWISGGGAFKDREDAAVSMAAESLGEAPIKRGTIGQYPQSLGAKLPQQALAREIMIKPISEQERIGVDTNPFMNDNMSDEEILDMANGSVLHPASDMVSMGTNWRSPDAKGLADISSFEAKHGTVPGGIPSTEPETGNLADVLMPGLKKTKIYDTVPGENVAPGRKQMKRKK